jgi:hypothetical protein
MRIQSSAFGVDIFRGSMGSSAFWVFRAVTLSYLWSIYRSLHDPSFSHRLYNEKPAGSLTLARILGPFWREKIRGFCRKSAPPYFNVHEFTMLVGLW